MRLDVSEARARFSAARVARLCTIGAGSLHPVPVTFACDGDVIVMAVDDKPKATRELRRLRDIEASPSVALLVDHYEEDWSRLWWVRAAGSARVLREAVDMARPLDLLARRYQQYRALRPAGPVIRVDVRTWSGWTATDP
ncbi:MAG: TIGR03668 family PPOX class F420-dependent oxidoreductase [Sciscionella sp.]